MRYLVTLLFAALSFTIHAQDPTGGSCEGSFNSCPSDLSGNGNVGSEDLLIFLADFDLSCDEIFGQ
jgi:hypothetical protein